MKVELFAILKNHAAADTAARQSIQRLFADMADNVEPFLSFEDAKSFYAEMGKAFGRADVVVASADEGSFLEQKWNLLKALGLKSEICPAVLDVIRENTNVPDATMKAHALMPKDAAVFLTADGLFSGFAVESGKQTLLYLPMIGDVTQEMLQNGIAPYFASRQAQQQPSPPQFTVPDNNMRFAETAKILADQDMTVAFAATQTVLYVRNGVRANPLFGDAFIPATVEDDPSSRDSATERMACLADAARREIGTTLGAAISNIYHVGMDSKELFLYVALADSRSANVKKIIGVPGMSTSDLVAMATDTLYSMLQDYAAGGEFPPENAEVRALNLYEEGMQPESENKKQKSGTAVKIVICVLIAVILCVLIGLFFKDEVAALFDGTAKDTPAVSVVEQQNILQLPTEPETEPEETTDDDTADVDFALFGTADDGNKAGIRALSAFETPVYVNFNTGIRDYVPASSTTATTEPTTQMTITQAAAPTQPLTTLAAFTQAATTAAQATATTAVQKTTVAVRKAAAEEAASEAETTEKETKAETSSTRSTTKAIITAVTAAPTTTTTTAPSTTAAEPVTSSSAAAPLTNSAATNGTFTFTVYGYGHGVGMSQMGALAYARQGAKYDEILQHYYPGTSLTSETPPATISYYGVARDTKDFLVRVVQQEIGGSAKASDIEALKAQAVAAYSFTKAKGFSLPKGGVACSSLPDSSLSSVVRSAVDAVFGQYLTYGGKTALTTFYSSSAGKTTSSQSVWGGNYAYLCGGISSPEEVSVTTRSFTAEEFKGIIDRYNAANPSNPITLSGNPSGWIEILGHDGARGNVGYVTSIRVGNKTMDGNTFRTMLSDYSKTGIRSHCFTVQYA